MISRRAVLLSVVATATLLLAMVWARRDGSRGVARRLVETLSEERLESSWKLDGFRSLDFAGPAAVEGLVVSDLEYSLSPEGLRGRSPLGDPTILLPVAARPWNQLRVTLQSDVDTVLQVFWALPGEEFSEQRKKVESVQASPRPAEHVIDLAREIPLVGDGVRLRLDPVEGKSPFVLRRVELLRFAPSPGSRDAEGAATAWKVRVGNETREAFVLDAGTARDWAVAAPPHASLAFGAAVRPAGECLLRWSWVDPSGAAEPIFEDAVGQGAFRDWSIPLTGLRSRRGALRAEVFAGKPDCTQALVSSPTVLVDRAPASPNVILISIDTLAAGHLQAYGAATSKQELFDRLAARGVLFENAFASSSLTNISHGAMLTGLPPLAVDPFWTEGTALQDPTLAEILRSKGYETAAFSGGVMVTEGLGFDRGFDRFYQEDTLYKPEAERTDIHSILTRAGAWLERAPEPFFLFLHTYEVHSPYLADRVDLGQEPLRRGLVEVTHMRGMRPVPRQSAGRFVTVLGPSGAETTLDRPLDDADLGMVSAAYDAEIGRVARALDDFLHSLERQGRMDNTILVVTSDHGEAFLEHGRFEHGLLYDENLRVPLLVVAPHRVPEGVRRRDAIPLEDLVPTVLRLAGIEHPIRFGGRAVDLAGQGSGRERTFYSFVAGEGFAWQSSAGPVLISNAALLREDFGQQELFDRRTDPLQRTNLLHSAADVPPSLTRLRQETLAEMPGIHLRLAAFGGRHVELLLQGTVVQPDRVYGFGLASEGFSPTDGGWRGRVHLGAEPELIVLLGPSSSASRDALQITVKDLEAGGRSDRFDIAFPDLQAVPSPYRGSGGSVLSVWRRLPKAGWQPPRTARGISGDELERLRSLGYIR